MLTINFGILVQLVNEANDMTMAEVIETLAMEDAPMTEKVIQLGVVFGVLTEDYKVGWSKEEV